MAGPYTLPAPPEGVPLPPAGPGMSRGTKVLLWSLGGCAMVAVLVVVGSMVAAGIFFTHNFNLRTSGVAAPLDFPVYPGAQETAAMGFSSKQRPEAAANLVQWQVKVGGGKVAPWYREHLNEGDWEVLDEARPGYIVFRRRSTGAEATLQVQDQFVQTVIQLLMTDDQPLGPGAHPAPRGSTPPALSSGLPVGFGLRASG